MMRMMKKLRRAILVLVALALFALPACAARLPALRMLSTKTCPACVQMEKVLKEINSKYAGKLSTEHIYLEDHPDIARQYNVRYVPTLIFVDANGKEVAQEVGYRSLDDVLNVFAKAGIKIR